MLAAETEEESQRAMHILEKVARGEDAAQGFTEDKLDELKAVRESMMNGGSPG